jgi:hypothetical protein
MSNPVVLDIAQRFKALPAHKQQALVGELAKQSGNEWSQFFIELFEQESKQRLSTQNSLRSLLTLTEVRNSGPALARITKQLRALRE